MTLQAFNQLAPAEAGKILELCCGAQNWVSAVNAARPFASSADLFKRAEEIWFKLPEKDWLEAFSHHPKIGDIDSLRQRFASTAHIAGDEQKGAVAASEEVLQGLKIGNSRYEEKFGFIFIVCASGKSATEMLALLNDRLPRSRATELQQAAIEQAKITRIRLTNLVLKEKTA